MPGRPSTTRRRTVSWAVAGLVALSGAAGVALAPAGSADTVPPDATTPATVSADALPTVQVDGVVWAQTVVGTTVYAGGKFTTARPAGAAAGTNTVARGNLLAYDIRTGQLVSSFAPNLNGQVLALAASPDGKRLYVAGEFTTANGANKYRIAAYDTTTGALVTSWNPVLDFRARALVATASTIYVGGAFNVANGNTRTRLAAFSASNGALLNWAPSADGQVMAMTLAPGGTKIVVGGQFTHLSGVDAYGMGALDATTGAVLPWNATTVLRDAGANAAINSLTTDGTSVYGSGYVFGAGGNIEGSFALDPADGSVRWVEDCHGDTYSTFPVDGALYVVGHAHFCGNVGGYPQTDPWTFHRGLAFSTAATGTLKHNTMGGYADFGGQPAPSLLTWFPDLTPGTVTGQNQAAWSVTGTKDYVVLGGEFPAVNGVAQQGLVRFAVRATAPNKVGPALSGANYTPALSTPGGGAVHVAVRADWDPDNELLTYKVVRDGDTAAPVYTTSVRSRFWDRPLVSFTDTGLTPGQTYRYRVYVTDPLGNTAVGDTASVTATGGAAPSSYALAALADGASPYWRLDETSGSAVADAGGAQGGTAGSGVGRGASGAIAGDADTASTFDGTSAGTVSTTTAQTGPDTFSVEAWVKTTTRSGGKIIGFGSSASGASSSYDRHLYMDNAGHVVFGVYPGAVRTVSSPGTYNDGAWHHLVGTLGTGGLRLFVDGAQVGADTATTSAQPYTGYWRVGGDTLGGWPGAPSSSYFAGTIDEVGVYSGALSAAQVKDHYTKGTTPAAANQQPTASFTASATDLKASFDAAASSDPDGSVAGYAWQFGDGSTGSGAQAQHTYASAGSYTVVLTVTDDKGATATASKTVTVTAPAPAPPPTPTVLASDTFGRTVTGSLGTADTGGAWTPNNAAFSVSGGTGRIALASPGAGPTAALDGVSSAVTSLRASVALDKAGTGGGVYVSLLGRKIGTSNYQLKLKVPASGAMTASLVSVAGGTTTTLTSLTLTGLTYAAGDVLQTRLDVTGTSPTTISAKVWRKGDTEPSAWQLTTTDSTAALQAAGGVGVMPYLSGTATNAPVTLLLDDLTATSAG